jgi:hypothetical protein
VASPPTPPRLRLTLLRCALGLLAVGLCLTAVTQLFLSVAGELWQSTFRPETNLGSSGRIGTFLMGIRNLIGDWNYVKWAAAFLPHTACLVLGIMLIRGSRPATRLLRRAARE